jgi:nucleoside-diphosphate-sugar epimerase
MDATALKDKKILVTGGAGFIGSNLTIALVKAGARVRVLDNLSTGRTSNLDECENDIEFINDDIRGESSLRTAVKDIELIFHQAAIPSVPRSIVDPLTSLEVNAQGTLKLLLAARDNGVKRVVYASSSSIYGDSPALPKEESMPVDLKSPYALSKYSGERHCWLFTNLYDLETVSLRYFNVFGPRQDPTSQYAAVIPRFITSILKDETITIYGDGEQTRDFTYIENVVEANILAASAPNAVGEVINIACGSRITIKQLAEFLMDAIDKRVGIESLATRPGEVRDSLASITRAEKLFGYQPKIDVWEGLRRTISWFSHLS